MQVCENESVSPFFFYKITCREKENKSCYIGKTKNFYTRVATHKSHCKFSNIKLYQYIRDHNGWENFDIEIIHKCICDEKSSILLEGHFITEYKNKGFEMLNSQNPYFYPRQEYNKKKCQEHYAIEINCECGWYGSKMNYCKHLKNSKQHKNYCLKKIENELNEKLLDISPMLIVLDGLSSPQFVSCSL